MWENVVDLVKKLNLPRQQTFNTIILLAKVHMIFICLNLPKTHIDQKCHLARFSYSYYMI